MIYVNSRNLSISSKWLDNARDLTRELLNKLPDERSSFIDAKRTETWGHQDLVNALRQVVGNKCWYSEVSLDGADPNVDHFRPKGRVVEIDCDSLIKTDTISRGYWWLAFEPKNFRLSSQHSNQRRVDEDTDGGKWDFFPVEGARAPETTEWELIGENVIPLDPCSYSDMSLLWFDPDGKPGLSKPIDRATPYEVKRIKVTVWLYHLDKKETAASRARHIEGIRKDIKNADIAYKLWNPNSNLPNLVQKNRFDNELDKIKTKIADSSIFAGAKRCAVQLAKSEFTWIEEFKVI